MKSQTTNQRHVSKKMWIPLVLCLFFLTAALAHAGEKTSELRGVEPFHKISFKGSGRVSYKGTPQIGDLEITGSGKITKIDP